MRKSKRKMYGIMEVYVGDRRLHIAQRKDQSEAYGGFCGATSHGLMCLEVAAKGFAINCRTIWHFSYLQLQMEGTRVCSFVKSVAFSVTGFPSKNGCNNVLFTDLKIQF